MTYEVIYTRQFHEQLMELPDPIYDRVEHSIDIIISNPGLARNYDPSYEAAFPPIECKWYLVPNSHKVLYLTINPDMKQIQFLFVGDTREDPLHRFDYMEFDN